MNKKRIILITLLVLLLGSLVFDLVSKDDILYTSYDTNIKTLDSEDYIEYLSLHNSDRPKTETTLTYDNINLSKTTGYKLIDNPKKDELVNSDSVIYADEESNLTFNVKVEESGYYNIKVTYYPIEGKSSNIEREILINDTRPYEACKSIIFSRIWGNETNVFKTDNNGNDISPKQIEKPDWMVKTLNNRTGLVENDLLFYFDKNENNTLTLSAVREPIVIDTITIYQEEEILSYSDYEKLYEDVEKISTKQEIKVEAEKYYRHSSPTLFPSTDKTSAKTSEQDAFKTKINMGGGNNWKTSGDWIEYQFDVEETGLYNISLRGRQTYFRGGFVTRHVTIDGKTPFKELENCKFSFSHSWNIYTLGTENKPFEVYLEKGTHTIRFEAVLGDYNYSIKQIENLISELNTLYRSIIIITTTQPDSIRDYELEKRLPTLMDDFKKIRQELKDVSNQIESVSNGNTDKTAIIDQMVYLLNDYIKDSNQITKKLSDYQSYISALGTWVLDMKDQALGLDYILIHSNQLKETKVNGNIFERLTYKTKMFIASFIIDYNDFSSGTGEESINITVWVGSGKDQANILRRMVDESFRVQFPNVSVTLQLVSMESLLPATLVGNGPDVAMGVGKQIPVNYALRNAVYDLTNFEDFEEVSQRFMTSAITPFEHLGGYYALPETELFPVLFYRTDILNELGLEVPQTWTDVTNMIPDLQRKNLDFYLPLDIVEQNSGVLPPNVIFTSMLYQQGLSLYSDDYTASGLQEDEALEVFKLWTDYYTNYSFDINANFSNRFRSGEMPIGIAYYSMYNTLSVFAPEISDDWEFTLIPGTMQEDGTIDRSASTTGTGVIIMEQSKEKEMAWEFVKWWTSTEVQVEFGRQMEGILGAAARYNTANVEALSQLPWPTKDLKVLLEQWSYTRGVPEVAGGYFTGRHLDNALRKVINEKRDAREVLFEYAEIINAEIKSKRKEFGLD